MKGAYVLLIGIWRPITIEVGSLGRVHFKQGIYAYVGSALNNLESRIARHLSREKSIHWHIDSLTVSRYATIHHIVVTQTTRRVECKVSRMIASLPFSVPVPNFGSSDCSCNSHLHMLNTSMNNALAVINASLSSLQLNTMNVDPTCYALSA